MKTKLINKWTLKVFLVGLIVAVSATHNLPASWPDVPLEQIIAQQAKHSTSTPAWGAASNGLQMSLSMAQETNTSLRSGAFLVGFRNVGNEAVLLNLGIALANGKTLLPQAISLRLTDAQGHERVLQFSDRRHPVIAGRTDNYVVALPPAGTCTVPVSLDQFWCPATREFHIALTNGPYRITAQFEGRSATQVNRDTERMRWMSFWQGTLQAAPLSTVYEQP
jgi:hypothetical protein